MVESKENFEIAHTIIKLGQNLKMNVVAEGIETSEQLAQLKILNCEYGQGYFFAKPMEADAAEMFAKKSLKNLVYPTNQSVMNAALSMWHRLFSFEVILNRVIEILSNHFRYP